MSKNKQNYLQIGEIAKQSGISVSTLRYYQEIDLLQPSFRDTSSKYRYYQPSDVALAKFIKKSQKLGFSLDEIKQILNERHAGRSPCPVVRKIAEHKILELHEKINELNKLEKELQDYLLNINLDLESKPDDKNICGLIHNAKI